MLHDDCEHDLDKFWIAHVQNMTETITDNPNFDVYINGTLVIKKVLPVDGGKCLCVLPGRGLWGEKGPPRFSILPKVMFIKVIYNYDNINNTGGIHDNSDGNLAVDNPRAGFFVYGYQVEMKFGMLLFLGKG